MDALDIIDAIAHDTTELKAMRSALSDPAAMRFYGASLVDDTDAIAEAREIILSLESLGHVYFVATQSYRELTA